MITTVLLILVAALMAACIYIGFDDWRAARQMRKEEGR